MTASTESPLCFVVTRNHGSLVDTMLFLHGTDLLDRSVLLLPPELYATHKTGLGASIREYNSEAELLGCVDAERPSLVFLFCGYLLTSQRLLTASQLRRFLSQLAARRCPTVTNDPCWGLLASKLTMTSELPARTLAEKAHRAWVEWLIARKLRESYRILNALIHCYPVAVDQTIPPAQLRTVAYFNPRLLMSFDERGEPAAAGSPGPGPRPIDTSYWLFILASLDYAIQVNRYGQPAFIDALVGHLRRANEVGRHAVLIAPDECLASVKQASGSLDVSLIGFCDYRRYVALLLFAEYAFYWNVASSSGIYRLVNGLPVFHFDKGHVSRWFDAFFERTVELLYHGHTPVILDQREPLQPDRLERLAGEYRRSAADVVRHLKRLPSPSEVVARLVKEGAA
jgi:hypothetical protein